MKNIKVPLFVIALFVAGYMSVVIKYRVKFIEIFNQIINLFQ